MCFFTIICRRKETFHLSSNFSVNWNCLHQKYFTDIYKKTLKLSLKKWNSLRVRHRFGSSPPSVHVLSVGSCTRKYDSWRWIFTYFTAYLADVHYGLNFGSHCRKLGPVLYNLFNTFVIKALDFVRGYLKCIGILDKGWYQIYFIYMEFVYSTKCTN